MLLQAPDQATGGPTSFVQKVAPAVAPKPVAPPTVQPLQPMPASGDPAKLTPASQGQPKTAAPVAPPMTPPAPTPIAPAPTPGPSAATPQAPPMPQMPSLTAPMPVDPVAPTRSMAPPSAPADARVSAPAVTPQIATAPLTPPSAASLTPPSTPSVQPVTPSPSLPNNPVGNVPSVNGAAVNNIDPSNSLIGDSITPTNSVDRFQLAQSNLQNYLQNELPSYRAQLRNTVQNNAAFGRLGSGMLRTDVGNLDLAEQQKANTAATGFLNNALEGTIGDAANNRNELRTERDYQNGLENQAYDRNLQGITLNDALTNSAFGRSLAQEQMGEQNNPANTSLILSSIFGNNAAQANNALGSLIGNTTANNAASQYPPWLQQLLNGDTPTSDDPATNYLTQGIISQAQGQLPGVGSTATNPNSIVPQRPVTVGG